MLHLSAKLRRTSHRRKESTSDVNPQQPRDGECSKLKSGLETDMEKDMPKSLLKIFGAALRLQRGLLWFMTYHSCLACLRNMKKISKLCGFHYLSNRTDVESQPPCSNEGNLAVLTPQQILYHAALNGDWTRAKQILDCYPNYVRDRITARKETLLHIAALGGNTLFVSNLVGMLEESDLELKNEDGSTAFCHAVVSGVVENVMVMRNKNRKLPIICSHYGMAPIRLAALVGQKKMVSYLYTVTPLEELSNLERFKILEATIMSNMYDVALNVLNKDRQLALAVLDGNISFLHVLARKRTGEMQQGIWPRFLGSICLWHRIQEKALAKKAYHQLLEEICTEFFNLPEDELSDIIAGTEVLHYFAKEGNAKILAKILRKKPDLLWQLNSNGQTIFHVAVIHRQEEVFDLIYNIGHFRELIILQQDKDENNILHLTAKLGWPSRTNYECLEDDNKEVGKIMPQPFLKVSGAALQFQRELLWFKEVGNIVPQSYHEMKNKEGKTPKQLFSEEHRALMKDGEQWMRDTANSCIIAATLIATMVFAAAFTVPGGNNGDTGTPVFIKRSSFTVYTVSDAVAMFSSIVSIIMFLSILISRYAEDDFHVSLPLKLLVGLTSLFVSIVGMLVAFVVAFFLIYDIAWQPILIAAFAGVPFALFLLLNFKLTFDTTKSIMLSLFSNFKRTHL